MDVFRIGVMLKNKTTLQKQPNMPSPWEWEMEEAVQGRKVDNHL